MLCDRGVRLLRYRFSPFSLGYVQKSSVRALDRTHDTNTYTWTAHKPPDDIRRLSL